MTTPSTSHQRRMNPLALVFLLSGFFFLLFIVISAVIFFSKSTGGWKTDSRTALFSKSGVAVLEVKGVITDSRRVLKRLKRIEEDDSIRGVVLRLNSPGGSVAPSQEIYEAVKKFPKPIVASMDSVAASGAFYIACGAKKVLANAGTLTGSIGVIMEFANLRRLYEWAKVERYAIKTGKFKDAGSEFRDMTPEERALLQNLVDDVLVQFKTAVRTGRKMTAQEVDAIADGRIVTGAQAVKLKLVDQIGTMQDAVEEVAKLADIKGKPHIVYPAEHKPFLKELFMGGDPEDEDAESQSSIGWIKEIAQGVSALRGIRSPGLYWLWNGAY